MSSEQPTTTKTSLLPVDNDNLQDNTTIEEQKPKPIFQSPVFLNEMLQNKELLMCYKCKEPFSISDTDEQQQHDLDSNNILLGIILNQRTPSSICLKCLSLKMMDVITEQFTKNSKDYQGMFFSYEQKFKK